MRGGFRSKSGSFADPNSARSDARGFTLDSLPPEGYRGEFPAWPLPIHRDNEIADRAAELWELLWRTPQACVWITDEWRWETIAEYCQLKALVERGAPAAYHGVLFRYREDLGLSPTGLKLNGWAIAVDAAPSTEAPSKVKAEKSMREKATSSGQFKVIPGGKRAG